jgi:hydroxymethylbilane synthase
MKDVPAELAAGLVLAAISEREDPRDALLTRPGGALSLEALPEGAHVGTSSLRRTCQLRALRPDLRISPLRGNVDTRLRKLDEGEYDAIVLAAAGLSRLGLGDRISARLDESVSLPAVGQGALGLEVRPGEAVTRTIAEAFNHDDTARCVQAERTFSACLEGSCQTPIAALARRLGDTLSLSGLVGSADGRKVLRVSRQGSAAEPEALGRAAAAELLALGARALLGTSAVLPSAETGAVLPSAEGEES